MISISADELVVCCNSWAAHKLRRAKNLGRSGTSNFPDSPPRKNVWDVAANRCDPHVRSTHVSSKRDVATANDFIYRIVEMCAVARAPPVIAMTPSSLVIVTDRGSLKA